LDVECEKGPWRVRYEPRRGKDWTSNVKHKVISRHMGADSKVCAKSFGFDFDFDEGNDVFRTMLAAAYAKAIEYLKSEIAHQ